MPRTWLRERVIYEVFPRNFSASGDLAGVTARLGHLAELGVGVVWLMPIHPIGLCQRKGPLGSPYAIADHRAVDPALGDMDDLRGLVQRAHTLGLRVIMDFVANHGAWDGVVTRQHPEWVLRDDQGQLLPAKPQWQDVVGFDHDHPQLRRYLVETLLFWLLEAEVDGFRCDVAGIVPLEFWREARAAMDALRPDAALLAEAYQPALMEVFDLCYDTCFYRAVRRMVRGGDPAALFWEARARFQREFPRGSARMTYIENHDQRRAASYLGAAATQAATALLLCFEGAPLIHNGQEIGSQASTFRGGLFDLRPIDWSSPDVELEALHVDLLWLRAVRPALSLGALEPLDVGHPSIVAFERSHAEDHLVVLVNLSDTPAMAQHPCLARYSTHRVVTCGGGIVFAASLAPCLTLAPWGWVVMDL